MKINLARLQQALEQAIQALEELEQALDAGDGRKVAARLYELNQALKEATREASGLELDHLELDP